MESTGDEQPSATNTNDLESEESQPQSQPQNEPNVNNELQNNLNELKNLIHDLRNTREPTRLSLATSLDHYVESIDDAYGQLLEMTWYRDEMREYYATGLSKDQIKDLNITKAQLYNKFTYPRTGQPPAITKRRVCMDWCHYEPWKQNWMKRWFMVFDKPPCNNREVPQYFLRKLWAEFELGLHVNYFDITEFQGVGLGSAQDRPAARRNPLRGPPLPRRDPNPAPQVPHQAESLDTIEESMRRATVSLLRHSSFVTMSGAKSHDDADSQRHEERQRDTGVGPSGKTPTGSSSHTCPRCGHVSHGTTQEHAPGSFMDELLRDDIPSSAWEDIGSPNLDFAMFAAENISVPYTQLGTEVDEQPSPPGMGRDYSFQMPPASETSHIPPSFSQTYSMTPSFTSPRPPYHPSPLFPAPSFIPRFHVHPPPTFYPNSPTPSHPSLHSSSLIRPAPAFHSPSPIPRPRTSHPISPIRPPPPFIPHFPIRPPPVSHPASPIPRASTSHSTSPIRPSLLFPPTSRHRPLIPLERPMFPSIVQPVGAYRHRHPPPYHPPPSTSPPTVTTTIPTFVVGSRVATSIVAESTVVTAATVPPLTIASEQDVNPTAPPVSQEDQSSPVVNIFSGGIAERVGSRKRTPPSTLVASSMVPETLSSPRTKHARASSSSKKRKIDFGDETGSAEGGPTDL